jgi:predicted transcriptional regulator
MTRQLTIRLDDDLRAELEAIAEQQDRSLAYIVIKAAKAYVAANPAKQKGRKK